MDVYYLKRPGETTWTEIGLEVACATLRAMNQGPDACEGFALAVAYVRPLEHQQFHDADPGQQAVS